MREGGRAPRICGWGERVLRKRPSSPLGEPTSFLLSAHGPHNGDGDSKGDGGGCSDSDCSG